MINKLRKKDKYDLASNIIVFVIALLFLYPLLWLLTSAFKTSSEIYQMPPTILPENFHLGNFQKLFSGNPAIRWVLNSVIVATSSAGLSVIFSSLAAYGFAKMKFKGKNILFVLVIASVMIPKETFIVPLFEIVVAFDWVDTYQSMIIPNLGTGLGTFLLYSFFKDIPDSIRESAKIDGANEWTIFRKLMLPIVAPGIGALFILNFVTYWNDYLWQLLMARSEEMQTISVGAAALQQALNPDIGLRVAGATLAAIPMVIIFLMFQRFFTSGITAGAVKE
ncbi:carbohydrate ABC transporter permease [Marinilactibacillus psychrotolerans]|uniref:carbohydrate ABC transporter permease n=1 Tax=Marinilactibacillus psychrotolerans TaxID=191770 RepID=UPI00388A7F2A